MVSSLGFLFASNVPDLEVKKSATWKHHRHIPNKSLLSLAKGAGKGQPNKTENFENNHSIPAKYYRKTSAPPTPILAKTK